MSQTPATATPMVSRKADAIADLGPVYSLVQNEFRAINQLIPNQLSSDVALVEDIGKYIVDSGGKRLRPLIVLLSSQALGYQSDQHVPLATIIEFLHTATLLHDDVVDHSGLRRGKPTANQKWGNAPSVLVGDFLYSRAFQLMVELGSLEIMAVLSQATNTIAEGEVMQLANIGNCNLDEAEYLEVIRCKIRVTVRSSESYGCIVGAAQRQPRLGYTGRTNALVWTAIRHGLSTAGRLARLQRRQRLYGQECWGRPRRGQADLAIDPRTASLKPSDKAVIEHALQTKNLDALPQYFKNC